MPPGGGADATGFRGLLDRIEATIAAARRLVTAHVELAKTELGAIADEVKSVAIKASIALGLLLFVGMLLPIGLVLFLGEALFGSLGWGVLHGTELGLGVALALVLSGLGLGSRTLGSLVVGVVLGTLVGVALGSGVVGAAWTTLGDQVLPGIVPEWRATLTALAGGALVVGILGALAGVAKGGGSGFVGGLVGGAVLGAILGSVSLASVDDARAAAGIGVAVALAIWPIMSLAALRSFDAEALKARFYPTATVETAQETFEWLKRIRG